MLKKHLDVFIQWTKAAGCWAQARSLPFVSVLANCSEDTAAEYAQ